MSTKCVIADRTDLMKRYLDGKDALSNDEREILLFSLYIESRERKGLAYEAIKQMGVFVDPPKPAPATPAATPMAALLMAHAFVYNEERAKCSCGWIGYSPASFSTAWADYVEHILAAAQPQRESEIPAGLIEELDRQVHGNDSGWHACVLCGCPERGAHFPACIVAKMRQRESEQPEQALLEALQLISKFRRRAKVDCDPANGSAITQQGGRIWALAADMLDAALSPQTDSQETP